MAIQAVLFDAVGTLLEADPPVARVYCTVGQKHGSALDEAEIQHRFRAAMAQQEALDLERELVTSELREQDRWRRIIAEVFSDVTDSDKLFAELWQHFASAENWRLFSDVLACWQALESGGLTVGIASNFDARLQLICRKLPPLDVCQHLFVSSQIEVRKPHRRFFETVQSRLRVDPDEILLVGDELDADYHGARAAGWQALLLDRAGNASGPHNLHSLAELPGRVA